MRQSNPGERYKTLYSYAITQDGIKAVEAGKVDMQEYIQSFGDACNINAIIARYKAGDLNALMEGGEGQYGDFTGMPTTMNEVMSVVQNFEKLYNSLADDARELFPTFSDFIRGLGSINSDSIKAARIERNNAKLKQSSPAARVDTPSE